MRTPAIQDRMRATAALLLGALALGACAGMTRTQQGAVIGAGVGAAAGAGVAAATDASTTKSVLIGAVVGGAAGAIIGQQMDRQARELEKLEGAQVERVGEGILVTLREGVLFPFGSDQLTTSARQTLTQFATTLKENPTTQIMIVGHTDSVGTDAYNQRLSERRALSTSMFLQTQGVAATRLSTSGRGESEPIAANATDEGRRQNRRVEFAIYASEAYRNELQRGSSRE